MLQFILTVLKNVVIFAMNTLNVNIYVHNNKPTYSPLVVEHTS